MISKEEPFHFARAVLVELVTGKDSSAGKNVLPGTVELLVWSNVTMSAPLPAALVIS